MKLQVSRFKAFVVVKKGRMLSFSCVPLVGSLGIYIAVLGLCMHMWFSMFWGLVLLVFSLVLWVVEDQVKEGFSDASLMSELSVKYAILIFIFSEFIFFLSVLFSAFYVVGKGWSEAWVVVDFYGVPSLVSVVLLSSGVSLTAAHYQFTAGGRWGVV